MIQIFFRWMAVSVAVVFFTTACGDPTPNKENSTEVAEEINEETRENNDGVTTTNNNDRPFDEKDADFLVHYASKIMMNIQMSQMAEQSAVTPQVKEFAKETRMANEEIKKQIEQVATTNSITLPGSPGDDEQRKINELKEKKGIDFDQKYIDYMKKSHDDAKEDLTDRTEKSEDNDIKGLSGQMASRLETQFQKAQSLEKVIN